ncbi:tRNA (guanine-N(1)-)-methyltransferase [Buchnera aphidicola (Nipponaphis monzeni)]|uniref:tRNA (guanine-N(1)-)-methyltransferase n=1 Tax=Buchnera aphidicola (Nipponaphis monzeni) TaxID=2495405 RepID=A0A455TAE4_9GAMM|nr:tRNA (guanosine(37)-N1)-methyltransferase TrmD [Buchnera aphidicola]BBI01314.1 tRNA (guanine-N(1)-)-methyltransferase [Buchnera aphidicola (Nipponaphis monzeni)]
MKNFNSYKNVQYPTLHISVISIFPEMFQSITNYGVTGKAIKKKIINIHYWNPRDYCFNKHKKVDDKPYGGGYGMIMNMIPLYNAIQQAKIFFKNQAKVLYLSPQGKKLNNNNIIQLTKYSKLILVCGRYKGIDERLIHSEIDEEWSIGDYIVSGGELPAMILIDALSRFIPGVLGTKKSAQEDSFYNGLLDHPQYTRPRNINGMQVPKILLSGNHSDICNWKKQESLRATWIKRPDLLKKIVLTEEQKKMLKTFKKKC